MKKSLLCLVIYSFFITFANASLFGFKINVDGVERNIGFNNVLDFIDDISKDNGIEKLTEALGISNKKMTDFNNGRIVLTMRGIDIAIDLSKDSNNHLKLNITDSTGLIGDFSFTGLENDNLETALKELGKELEKFLNGKFDSKDFDLGSVFATLTKESIASTPNDPLAGNPLSLMNQMLDSDFYMATNSKKIDSTFLPQVYTSSTGEGEKKVDTLAIYLPFNMFFGFTEAGSGLRFDFPISYIEIEKAIAYNIQLGLAWRQIIKENWSITPSFRYGINASVDLMSAGVLYSLALTSKKDFILNKRYTIELVNTGFNVNSMKRNTLLKTVEHFTEVDNELKRYFPEYGIKNYGLKNGISLKYKFGPRFSIRTGYVYTYLFGKTKLYIQKYNDVNLDFIVLSKSDSIDSLFLRAKYTFGDNNYKLIGANIGISF